MEIFQMEIRMQETLQLKGRNIMSETSTSLDNRIFRIFRRIIPIVL